MTRKEVLARIFRACVHTDKARAWLARNTPANDRWRYRVMSLKNAVRIRLDPEQAEVSAAFKMEYAPDVGFVATKFVRVQIHEDYVHDLARLERARGGQ